MAREFTFGAGPERLRRLLFEGMEEPEGQEDVTHSQSDNSSRSEGEWIGNYRLIRTLGEGGMGIVYLAEQEQSIKRRVALKVIKPGLDSKRVIARFEAERQALALLDHPNIAHVYDAEMTQTGHPYFVMEYVQGVSITDYCDHHKLTIEQRLRQFAQICQAVQHAHQKGIIHRDIKPSNILVSTEDDKAIPKIIDFGVAKAMTQPLTERTHRSEESQLLGTPEYMSPEQADMASEDIDTRSDVYSLGVLLYILLTGVLPFDPQTLRDSGIENIRKTICETDPKTPSMRLTKLGEEGKKLAENRRTEIHALAKYLKKELGWIPLKAMRKERSERYRSASELADDIDNFLKGAPLMAGPLTAGYRLQKFLRRHKALVGGVAVVLAVSAIGAMISLTFALGQARARAESEAVTNFLGEDVLQAASAIKSRDATVTDILDTASKNLEGKFEDRPRVKAQIHWHLGRAYGLLSDHRSAVRHLGRSYQLRREQFGEYNNPTTYTKNYLALAYSSAGQYSEAERLLTELIEGMDPKNVRNLPTRKCNLACIYINQGRYEEAEHLFKETLEKDISPKVGVYTMHGLGCLYMIQGNYEKAEKLFKEGIELGARELPGKDHPHTLLHVNSLAVLRTKQKQYEEAERLFLEALEARKNKHGEDHPDTLETKNDLAVLYKEQGDYDKAEPLLLEAFEGRRLKLGDTHPHTLDSISNLIDLYEAWNKPEKAKEWRTKLGQIEDFDE